jgi:hypothetical protein
MLSDEQVLQFRTSGFCVARVPLSADTIGRAAAKVWELCPPTFDRYRPKTWQGPIKDCCKTQSIEDRRGRVKFRECVRGEQWVYNLTAANPDLLPAIRDLIDEPVVPQWVRGLYPVFPTKPRKATGHCDQHKFQVGVVLYLSDVLPHGGGFTVWPGSHLEMMHHHASVGGEDRLASFDEALKRIEAKTRPVEITGPAGTVIFWHQRLVHTAGINTSQAVRHATLCDFKNERFLAIAEQPLSDPWATWSARIRELAA